MWNYKAPDQSWTRLSDVLVWIFSLCLLFLRYFPSVDLNRFFLGKSSGRQDLVSTGVLGLVQSHPAFAILSLHLPCHFHPKALQVPEQCISALCPQCLSHFNICLSWINAKGMKETQVHKSSLVRKSYFQHLKRSLNWIAGPVKAGTSICAVELCTFLSHSQRARPWDMSTYIQANVKPQCLVSSRWWCFVGTVPSKP